MTLNELSGTSGNAEPTAKMVRMGEAGDAMRYSTVAGAEKYDVDALQRLVACS